MTRSRTTLGLFLLCFVFSACGDDGRPMPDVGPLDTGAGDVAMGDTGTVDSAVIDTAVADTGAADSGLPDAAIDGGAEDAMMSDGAMDASSDALPDGGRPVGAMCTMNADCASGICIVRVCRAGGCTDGVQNGDETDVDCGGSCAGCAPGGMCDGPSDCASNICMGGMCRAPDCTDGVINQDETDVDCGGAICPDRCAVMEMCTAGTDCETGSCMGGECQPPSCTDGVLNGSETDIDCGGPAAAGCPRCEDFRMCARARDCMASVCRMGFCGSNPCIPFGSDTFGYTGCSYTPTTLPCPDISATGTATGLTDDDDIMVPIGFDFDFYGTTYTMVNIDSNGGLTFDAAGFSLSNSCPLPGSGLFDPLVFIAVMWDDLDPGEPGSEVWYQTLGTAPNRRFVVQWDTERFGAGTDRGVFTVVLDEATDNVQVCYVDTGFGSATYDAGASATAGIQGSATDSNQFSCNTADLTDGLLVQYLHP